MSRVTVLQSAERALAGELRLPLAGGRRGHLGEPEIRRAAMALAPIWRRPCPSAKSARARPSSGSSPAKMTRNGAPRHGASGDASTAIPALSRLQPSDGDQAAFASALAGGSKQQTSPAISRGCDRGKGELARRQHRTPVRFPRPLSHKNSPNRPLPKPANDTRVAASASPRTALRRGTTPSASPSAVGTGSGHRPRRGRGL